MVTTYPTITECHCKGDPAPAPCRRTEKVELFEVDVGDCEGQCDAGNFPLDRQCTAGTDDNYDPTTPDPAPTPSVQLIAARPYCASRPMGFDAATVHNRWVCHTFADCFRHPCPVVRGVLEICVRANNFYDAYNDGLLVGHSGVTLWSASFATLAGSSTWSITNPGATCFTLDLSNMPLNSANILPAIAAAGNLDFVVQDDTMVDYARLRLKFDNCQYCAPISYSINVLSTATGHQPIPSIERCDCFTRGRCQRLPLFHTYFPWDPQGAQRVDVGRCAGECPTSTRTTCLATYVEKTIVSSTGVKLSVPIVERCDCRRPIIISFPVGQDDKKDKNP